jgi:membrane associated rhomboid family serine protease
VFPLKDENPTKSSPHVTRILIVVNVVVFFFFWILGYDSLNEAIWNYGMIPLFVLNGERLYTLFTSIFMHGGILHLFGNMLYLHIFGDNIENAFGHWWYMGFYVVSGITASLVHILSIGYSPIPAVGASGAISGVLGAYIMLFPRARILTLVFYYWISITAIPAIFFLGFWFFFQLFAGSLTLGYGVASGVAYWAHIGGFLAGIALALVFKAMGGPKGSRRETSWQG